MTSLAELDLAYMPLEEPGFAADPLPHFARARQQHPWLAKCSFGYVVHEYAAIRELLRLEDKMRMPHAGIVELMGAKDTPWGRFIEESMQAQSGAPHKRLRDIVASSFTPRQANMHRPLMREVIAELLDEWAPKTAFDFELFASHFPISVMCTLIGASPDVVPRLRSSMDAIGLGFSMDRKLLPDLQQATLIMDEFVRELVADRRAGKRLRREPDLLDLLLAANGEGGMNDEELANLLIFLFVAGYDTSKNVLTLIMHVMLDRPDDYARCARDFPFCCKVTEETLRYHSPASAPRIMTEDVVYRDVMLPKETMLFIPWNIIGRDPRAVEDADAFQPERSHRNRHMAFGLGLHICLGQHIARAQIEEGLHLIAQRITKPKLAGPVGWRPFPGVWGIRGLPISFTPAAALVPEMSDA